MITTGALVWNGVFLSTVSGNGLPPGWLIQGLAKVGLVVTMLIAKRLILRNEGQTEGALAVGKETVGGANRHFAVAFGVPNHSQTRGELQQLIASTLFPTL